MSPIPAPQPAPSQSQGQGNGRRSALGSSSRCNSLSSSLSSLTWLTTPLACRQSPTGQACYAPQLACHQVYSPTSDNSNNTRKSKDKGKGSKGKGKGSKGSKGRKDKARSPGVEITQPNHGRIEGSAHNGNDDDEEEEEEGYDDVFGPEFKDDKENSRSATPEDVLSYDWANDPHKKPPFAYATLIFMALRESDKDKLSLSEIYDYVLENFAYYRHARCGWKNSIRHNLSQEKCFLKVDRDESERGKGGYWMLNPDMVDFDEMMSRRRRKFKRRRSVWDPTPLTPGSESGSGSGSTSRRSSRNTRSSRSSGRRKDGHRASRRSTGPKANKAKAKKAKSKRGSAHGSKVSTTITSSDNNKNNAAAGTMFVTGSSSSDTAMASSGAQSACGVADAEVCAVPHRRNTPPRMKAGCIRRRRLSPTVLGAVRGSCGEDEDGGVGAVASRRRSDVAGSDCSADASATASSARTGSGYDLSFSMAHLGLSGMLPLAQDGGDADQAAQAREPLAGSFPNLDMDLGASVGEVDGLLSSSYMGSSAMQESMDLRASVARRPSFHDIMAQLRTPGTSFRAQADALVVSEERMRAGEYTVQASYRGISRVEEEEIDDSDKPIPRDWLM